MFVGIGIGIGTTTGLGMTTREYGLGPYAPCGRMSDDCPEWADRLPLFFVHRIERIGDHFEVGLSERAIGFDGVEVRVGN